MMIWSRPVVRSMPKVAGMLTTLLASVAFGAPIGQVTHLSGLLSATKSAGGSKVLSVKSEIEQGDLLTTEADTYARVKFVDGGEVVLRPNSQLKIENYSFQESKPEADNVALSMLKGGLRAVTGLLGQRNKDKVSFKTNTATIGIRGTHFGALLCQGDCGNIPTASGQAPANGLHVDVTAGSVVLTNQGGQVQLNAGQFGFVANQNSTPSVVPPQQGIQVTMPPNIAANRGGGRAVGKQESTECKM